MTKICGKCGAQMADGELFCGECGTKYDEPVSAPAVQTQAEIPEQVPPQSAPMQAQSPAQAAAPDQTAPAGQTPRGGSCTKCGVPVPSGTRFCPKCGTPQNTYVPPQNGYYSSYAPQQQGGYGGAPKKSRTCVIIAVIAAAAAVAIILILVFAGVIGGKSAGQTGTAASAPASVSAQPTSGIFAPDDTEEPDDTEPPSGGAVPTADTPQTSWPTDGCAALLPAPGFGTITVVEDRGYGSYAIDLSGVTQADCESYIAAAANAGFNQNAGFVTSENDQGGYHYAAYNTDGIRFEILLLSTGDAAVFVGVPAS